MSPDHKSNKEPYHHVQIFDEEVVTDPDEMARLDAADAALAAAYEAAQREQDGETPPDHKGNGTRPQ